MVRNTGTIAWPAGTCLENFEEAQGIDRICIKVGAILPNMVKKIGGTQLRAPQIPGLYEYRLSLKTDNNRGVHFG